jgi:Protein of unknown function (DUF1549)/Protein of unknown function (DUF1553)
MATFRTTLVLALFLIAAGPELRSAPPARKAASTPAPAPKSTPASSPTRDPLAVAALIDKDVDKKLAEAKIPASPPADDAEYLRRLSLDLRGRVPTAERTAAFLADTDPDKRRKLVDEFLADSAYGEHFGTVWYHRMAKPTMDNRNLLDTSFRDWLAERFNANAGWDKVVREILTASGERDKNPATVFWLAHAEGNAKREIVPARVAADASHLFLGVKLECCECHNHPFDEGLKQTDFWGVAAFFAATHADHAGKKDDATPGIHESPAPVRVPRKQAAMHESAPFGSIAIPDSHGKTVHARFLLAETPNTTGLTQLRPAFASWLTSKKNPYFARATVNKLWANFFGRGIINPIDDMRTDAKATHPELLKLLADEFAASGFDTKYLVRCVCNSHAYQRTSRPLPENKSDEELYSHARLKVMSADMLFDSLKLVFDHAPGEAARGGGKGAGKQGVSRDAREQFRAFFHAEADDDAGVVEDYAHGMPQVLRLMNSQQLLNTTAVVERLAKAGGPEPVVEAIYLRVLSRQPTDEETRRAVKYVAGSKSPAKGYGDLLWALVNSAEFLFNH